MGLEGEAMNTPYVERKQEERKYRERLNTLHKELLSKQEIDEIKHAWMVGDSVNDIVSQINPNKSAEIRAKIQDLLRKGVLEESYKEASGNWKAFAAEVQKLNKKYGVDPEESDPDLPAGWGREYDALVKKYGVEDQV